MKSELKALVIVALALAVSANGLAQQESGGADEAQARAAYEAAVEAARSEERAALEAVERARSDLESARQEQAQARSEANAARSEARQAEREELTRMRAELSRVHESLRRASREVARVHRELDRQRIESAAPFADFVNLGDKAIIGVVLGDSTSTGVPVLGVSPDGPADRAGIAQGDVIVRMMDTPLAGPDNDDPRAVLSAVMDEVKVGDELAITVVRDGEEREFAVKADRREPFSWQSIVRLPSAPAAPGAPGAPTVIRRIEVPDIDTAELQEKLDRLHAEIDDVQVFVDTEGVTRIERGNGESYEYRFDTFSDLGGDVLAEANVWFGLPVTRGLKMAEVDEGLGAYFDVASGVLVLSAREDNDLQLRSGDVILEVGDRSVARPADVIRALRDWEPGAAIELQIKRDRRDRTLEVELPERTLGFDFMPFHEQHEVHPAPTPD